MIKALSKPILVILSVVMALVLASCTGAEQYHFFVELGDDKAQTQTLEEARAEWNPAEATKEQNDVIDYVKLQRFAFFLTLHEQDMERQRQAAQRPNDCISAMKQVFPSSSWGWGQNVIMRESGNNPGAQNRSSTAAGCWQMLRMHDHRYHAVGCTPSQKYDALCNTKAAYHLYQAAGTSPWRFSA